MRALGWLLTIVFAPPLAFAVTALLFSVVAFLVLAWLVWIVSGWAGLREVAR